MGALVGTQLLGLALRRYVLQLQSIATRSGEEIIAELGPAIQLRLSDDSAD